VDDNITGKRREVMRWRIERNEGWRGGEDDWEEGGPLHHYLSSSFL
jgi:hypothetical protein